MGLHLLPQLSDEPLSRFGEELGQRERRYPLDEGCDQDRCDQRLQEFDVAFHDDVVDQKTG